MRNKIVGVIMLGIAVMMALISYSFNKQLKNIIISSCAEGIQCPMIGSLNFQTNLSFALMA